MWNKLFTYNPFRSLTVAGVLGLALDTGLQAFDPNALTPQGHHVVQVLSLLVSILGLRRAVGRVTP